MSQDAVPLEIFAVYSDTRPAEHFRSRGDAEAYAEGDPSASIVDISAAVETYASRIEHDTQGVQEYPDRFAGVALGMVLKALDNGEAVVTHHRRPDGSCEHEIVRTKDLG